MTHVLDHWYSSYDRILQTKKETFTTSFELLQGLQSLSALLDMMIITSIERDDLAGPIPQQGV
jgi:hypothetical protein